MIYCRNCQQNVGPKIQKRKVIGYSFLAWIATSIFVSILNSLGLGMVISGILGWGILIWIIVRFCKKYKKCPICQSPIGLKEVNPSETETHSN